MRTNYPRHLPGFSYVGFHRYSLTFCTKARAAVFIQQVAVDLVLPQILRAADSEAMAVIAYCFMPDHVHLVVEGLEERSALKRFMALAKQLSGYQWSRARRSQRLWQRYGYERVLRDDESTRAAVKYVLENPIRVGLKATVAEYPYFGSSTYSREALVEFAYGSG